MNLHEEQVLPVCVWLFQSCRSSLKANRRMNQLFNHAHLMTARCHLFYFTQLLKAILTAFKKLICLMAVRIMMHSILKAARYGNRELFEVDDI